MFNMLRLINHQPYDHPAKISGIQVIKKKVGMLDTVTLYLETPMGNLHHSFFIKHEDKKEDAFECQRAFAKVFTDHLDVVARHTLETVINDTKK